VLRINIFEKLCIVSMQQYFRPSFVLNAL